MGERIRRMTAREVEAVLWHLEFAWMRNANSD